MTAGWEQRWYGPFAPAGWRDAPLWVASLVYRGGVAARNGLFDMGLRRPHRVAGLRVVSVGNLNVGGAGKTPVVIHLAQALAAAGRRVVVASRGYGRRSRAELLLAPGAAWPGPGEAGDEPLLVARRTGVPVLVGADRVALALRARAELAADTLLLDDGFQHRRLARDVDILVVDEAVGLGNGHLLPRGPLREPPRAARRANLLWVRTADGPPARIPTLDVPRVRARHGPRCLLGPDGAEHPPRALEGQDVIALCAIARPSAFERTLSLLGQRVVERFALADHAPFPPALLEQVQGLAARLKAPIVTTEKDAVRLPAGFPSWVVQLGVEVTEGAGALAAMLGL